MKAKIICAVLLVAGSSLALATEEGASVMTEKELQQQREIRELERLALESDQGSRIGGSGGIQPPV